MVILPVAVRDGRGEYRADDLTAVKTLQRAGVTADYAHPPHERTFIAQYSADEVLAVSMFVTQALSQECVVQIGYWLLHPLKAALPARNAAPVCVDVARVRVDGTKRDLEGLRVSGTDGERVVDAVKALLTGEPRPQKPA